MKNFRNLFYFLVGCFCMIGLGAVSHISEAQTQSRKTRKDTVKQTFLIDQPVPNSLVENEKLVVEQKKTIDSLVESTKTNLEAAEITEETKTSVTVINKNMDKDYKAVTSMLAAKKAEPLKIRVFEIPRSVEPLKIKEPVLPVPDTDSIIPRRSHIQKFLHWLRF